jgi:hypothetical protein
VGLVGHERSQVRDEQRDIVKRCLLVFLEVEAEPASSEAAIALGLLTRDERRQLERRGDRHPADLSRGYLGEHEVVVFQRPRKTVRGWPCEVDVARLRGRDGLPSLGENANQGFWNELTGIGVAVCKSESAPVVEALEGVSASCVDLLGEKTSTPTRPPTLQHAACCGIRKLRNR